MSRDDFFTLIHKGQRRELFSVTTDAGTLDWGNADAAADLGARWAELRRMLETHAQHEDTYFFPLLNDRAPELTEGLRGAHDDLERGIAKLSAMIAAAAAEPTHAAGLTVYRGLSAFVASYLFHLLEEETIVMPAIWQHCTDDDIRRARLAFLADQTPAGAVRSRRAILPAISPSERAEMVIGLRATAARDVFQATLQDARRLLHESDWARLNEDLATNGRTPS